MAYLLAHWHGKLSLGHTVWINLLLLTAIISVAEPALLSRFAHDNPAQLMRATLISLAISRLMIFPWQLIGLFRAAERNFIEQGNLLRLRTVQLLGLFSIGFTLVYSLEMIQSAAYYKQQLELYSGVELAPEYQLEVNAGRTQLSLSGSLDYGATAAVAAQLKANPGLRSVRLNSPGGPIYEGRGLARLFMQAQLDVYVYGECSSACVTAFIGGRRRYLGSQGKLGFHQYKIDRSRYKKAVLFFDPAEEQQRDLLLFEERGVAPDFLQKMFQQTADGIWFPPPELLIEAGVVHSWLNQ